MNIAESPVSSSTLQTSIHSATSKHKSSLFASLFKGESDTLQTEFAGEAKSLEQIINNIEELLQFKSKRNDSDDIRSILPITLMQETSDLIEQLLIEVQDSDFLKMLEGIRSMLSNEGIPSDKITIVLDGLENHHLVNGGELEVTNDEEYLLYVLKQVKELNRTLTNSALTKNELINLAKKLESILIETPEQLELSYEITKEMHSIIHVLEQKMNDQESNNGNNLLSLVHLFKGSSTNNDDMAKSTNLAHVTKQMQEVSKQAHQLIKEVLNEEQTAKINKQLTQLLEQAKQFGQDSTILHEDQVIEGEKSEVDKIWLSLQSMYDKRSSMNKGGVYVENAKVRSTDVGLWLQHMVSETNVSQTQPHIQLQQQMTPVEQYVMHVRTQDGAVEQNEQMMQQLKQIINQSAIGKNQFFKQLSITIQPEQLGEVTIRLVQVEGELIAKITVTSQATKSALESNLHQLKNMFAPHQVMIERQDGSEQANVDHEKQEDDQQHSSSKRDGEHHENDKDERSFQDHFEQILEETVGEL